MLSVGRGLAAGNNVTLTAGTVCPGGGHGGSGGGAYAQNVVAYDSVFEPNQPGSAGCSRTSDPNGVGGPGGGVIHLHTLVESISCPGKPACSGQWAVDRSCL